MSDTTQLAEGDLDAIRRLRDAFTEIKQQLARVIVGQDQVIEELLIALFSRGHCMLEGVPGLAKTLMISTLAKCLSLDFSRIQFTPDLMPADITGTEVIEENRSTGAREFKFLQGPLFANIVLADEIIRYTLALVRQTRIGEPGVPKFVRDWLSWGAGPRAVQYLILGGKARALLYGRVHVNTEDIQALAFPVLRHRILTNFTAASEGITSDTVVKKLLEETPSKDGELTRDDRFKKIFAS